MLTVMFKSGAIVNLHVSQKAWKYDDVIDIVSVEASDDELRHIIDTCPYLRAKRTGKYENGRFITNAFQRWFGDDARHAMSAWPCY